VGAVGAPDRAADPGMLNNTEPFNLSENLEGDLRTTNEVETTYIHILFQTALFTLFLEPFKQSWITAKKCSDSQALLGISESSSGRSPAHSRQQPS